MKPQVRGRRAAQTPRGGAVSPRTDRRAVPPPRPPGGGSQGPLCSGSARSRAPPRTSPWRRRFWKQVQGVYPQPHHGPGVRPDIHSDRTAEGQTSVLRPDPSCLCRRTPPSLLVSSALPLTDVEGNGGRDPRQEVSAGTLPVSVELPARYEDYSLARKKRNQAFSLILVCVALASICTELD